MVLLMRKNAVCLTLDGCLGLHRPGERNASKQRKAYEERKPMGRARKLPICEANDALGTQRRVTEHVMPKQAAPRLSSFRHPVPVWFSASEICHPCLVGNEILLPYCK